MLNNIKYIISRILNRRPVAIKNSVIDKTAAVGNGAQIVDSTIGRYTYIFESKLIATDVGAFCSIASDCTIGGAAHPHEWVSSSPVFYNGKNCLKTNFSNNLYEEYKRTKIGNDVWVGSKCLIKGGVSIGNGAVIGMGSVVTRDVPEYEIWAGNPARMIKKRFDENTIVKLNNIQWWNMSEEKLKELGVFFNKTDIFINYMEEHK